MPASTSHSFYYLGHNLSASQNRVTKLISPIDWSTTSNSVFQKWLAGTPVLILKIYLLHLYGSDEIDTLATHYGISKETVDGIELQPVLDAQELKGNGSLSRLEIQLLINEGCQAATEFK